MVDSECNPTKYPIIIGYLLVIMLYFALFCIVEGIFRIGVIRYRILAIYISKTVCGAYFNMLGIRILKRIFPHREAGVVVVACITAKMTEQYAYCPKIATTFYAISYATWILVCAIAYQFFVARIVQIVEIGHLSRIVAIFIDLDIPTRVRAIYICQQCAIIEW